MVNFSPLAVEIGLPVLGRTSKFQWVLGLGFVYVAQWRSTTLCTMFGRLLGWYTIYTFSWTLAP